MKENIFNLQFGAFLSNANFKPAPLDRNIAVKLMIAQGTKLSDNKLMTDNSGKYYVGKLEYNGETIWVYVPINYPLITPQLNQPRFALLMNPTDIISEDEFYKLYNQ